MADPHGVLARTRWMVKAVSNTTAEEWEGVECFWTRAMLPNMEIEPPCTAEQAASMGEFQQAANESGWWFSDGSGGPRMMPDIIRQSGAGVATVSLHRAQGEAIPTKVSKVGLWLGGVAGRQTVPHAEARGAQTALQTGRG